MHIEVKREFTSVPTEKEVLEEIIKSRGLSADFLEPPSPLNLTLHELGYPHIEEVILPHLTSAKEQNLPVVVYMDYDADGITGGAIMWETLYTLGFNVHPYIPNRHEEGYGFSKKGLTTLKDTYGTPLIITVDHGIAAADYIDLAKDMGMGVIVTDHHLKGERDPQCLATIHIPALSGSGVAYVVAHAIARHFLSTLSPAKASELEKKFSGDYLALAATGTVADLVPLLGPSRSIVKYGLEAYNNLIKPGLIALKQVCAIEKGVSVYDIGFKIAPRINAPGRLAHAMDALRLLCTTNTTRAQELSHVLNEANKERQYLLEEGIAEAKRMVEEEYDTLPPFILLYSNRWHEGIIGLIAGKIAEAFYRPTIVLTQSTHDETVLKGSARSIKNFAITPFLKQAEGVFIGVGGHDQAAGMSLYKDNLPLLKEHIKTAPISDTLLTRSVTIDIHAPLPTFTLNLAYLLGSLAPFGIGNPTPLFATSATVKDKKILGASGAVTKLTLSEQGYDFPIIFFKNPLEYITIGDTIHVAFNLETNTFKGTTTVQGVGRFISNP